MKEFVVHTSWRGRHNCFLLLNWFYLCIFPTWEKGLKMILSRSRKIVFALAICSLRVQEQYSAISVVLFAFACIIKHLQSGLWWFLEQRKMPRVKKRRKKRKGSERRGCPKNRQFIWERESEAVLSTCMSLKERNISSQTIQGLRKWTICELWKKKTM